MSNHTDHLTIEDDFYRSIFVSVELPSLRFRSQQPWDESTTRDQVFYCRY